LNDSESMRTSADAGSVVTSTVGTKWLRTVSQNRLSRAAADRRAAGKKVGRGRNAQFRPVSEALPRSPLREAIAYMGDLWPGLLRFLDDPRLAFDNNTTALCRIRPTAR
jgi:hypothetical protein